MFEGNPHSFVQVQTLLDGVTVAGHRLADQQQVHNLAEGTRHLLRLVQGGRFVLNRDVLCDLHAFEARMRRWDGAVFAARGG